MGEPDYVTVVNTLDPHKKLVMVMTYRPSGDEFIAAKTSQALSDIAARALAKAWAAALKVEIR